MKIFALALTLLSVSAFADTHGSVSIANGQYEKVVALALEEGGDLSRVASVVTIDDETECAVYKVQFSNRNNQSGKVKLNGEVLYVKAQTLPDAEGTTWPGQNVKTSVVKAGTRCN